MIFRTSQGGICIHPLEGILFVTGFLFHPPSNRKPPPTGIHGSEDLWDRSKPGKLSRWNLQQSNTVANDTPKKNRWQKETTHTHTQKKNKGCNLVKKQALSDHRSWSWLKFLVNFCFVLKQARFGTGSMARASGLALVGCFFSLGGPVLTRRRLQRLQMVARGAGEEWRWNWEICRGIQDLWMESWQWKRPGWWDWMVLVLDWIY